MHRVAVPTPRGTVLALRNDPPTTTSRHAAVMVSGLAETKEQWCPVMLRLGRSGRPAYSYDHPGQFDPVAGPHTVDSLASDLLALLDAISPDRPVHLVGGCFGGFVARELVTRAPHRVRSLVLLGSGRSLATSAAPLLPDQVETALRTEGIRAVFDRIRDDSEKAGLSTRSVERVRDSYLAIRPEFLTAFSRSVAEHRCPPRFEPPVLVGYGTADEMWTPQEQRELAARIGASVAEIEGAGHAATVTHPRAVCQMLTRFWDTVDDPAGARAELDPAPA
ncbi:alpha/beta hydrolase [Saccharopolyspora taberi]